MPIETEKTEVKQKTPEAGVEKQETKESEANKEKKEASAMERKDIIVKEVKQSKQMMQNIVLQIQQVVNAIRQLRTQLQLSATNDDPMSVKLDKEAIEKLKKKILEYGTELENMRGDLIREQIEELKNGTGAVLTDEQLQKKAEEMVEEMLRVIRE